MTLFYVGNRRTHRGIEAFQCQFFEFCPVHQLLPDLVGLQLIVAFCYSVTGQRCSNDLLTFHPPSAFPKSDQIRVALWVAQLATPSSGSHPLFFEPAPLVPPVSALDVVEFGALSGIWN